MSGGSNFNFNCFRRHCDWSFSQELGIAENSTETSNFLKLLMGCLKKMADITYEKEGQNLSQTLASPLLDFFSQIISLNFEYNYETNLLSRLGSTANMNRILIEDQVSRRWKDLKNH
ncbi:hypothetical protein OUZ56_028856 [Daphnia magna]|uniref:Uncharacterized protein n=1 Tax=Daphnia magna TaxID=35525 RepID=A0ABR0B547_9CRUS|nr:hypothetical protein OUZ56_028856 [Daphnia magna]